MDKRFSIFLKITLMLAVIFMSTFPVQAQGPVCAGGVCPDGATPPKNPDGGVTAQGMGGAYIYNLRGGYTAAGVGLRNRGFGTIRLAGIPTGATVFRAYLYWNIMDYLQSARLTQAVFAGHPIVGTYIGADDQTCWLPSYASSFSYRADVTAFVKGNGSYAVTGVASGLTTGVDPWSSLKAPLAQGASLVVVYAKSTYPPTQILIWDGAKTSLGTAASFTMGPITVSNPSGPAYATAVMADGQTSAPAGPNLLVNGNTLPVTFEGNDPVAGARFSQGNLWDTRRASVGMFLAPGSTSVNFGVNSSTDCVSWVAQVLSISNGALDTDGDKLLDGWEANGVNGINLPAMGASPFHKDIFVEHDWMPEHQPSLAVLAAIQTAFAVAPVSNPDGRNGIYLHNDRGQGGVYTGGNAVDEKENMGATCSSTDIWNGFDAYKSVNFAAARLDVFHYVIWAHNQCPGNSSSGLARGIPSSDFMVTLGLWPGFGTDAVRSGTFMHELGHNLGLTHGGNTNDHVNYKPNHLSVMSYAFQIVGVWRDGARRWDYTRTVINPLVETNLNETIGVTAATPITNYGTSYYCPNGSFVNDNTVASIDWNCNGTLTNPVSVDINHDGVKNTLGVVQNQWLSIIYNGGSIGAGLKPAAIQLNADQFVTVSPELSLKEFLRMQK